MTASVAPRGQRPRAGETAAASPAVARAARILRWGGLVAFPTETVYGLGADAENVRAVSRIFAVKGRPTSHPLIVHIASRTQLAAWGAEVSDAALTLAERFWPGPMTLIVRRRDRVPLEATGGLDTVALRVPAHAVAQALLAEFGGGIAAPSANRFGRVSPTCARHVLDDLGEDVDLVLDGGDCEVGIESTIVDVSSAEPAILRLGGVTREALEDLLGRPVPLRCGGSVRSPGQHASHYAPRARVIVLHPDEIAAQAAALRRKGQRVCVLAADLPAAAEDLAGVALPRSPEALARVLYDRLREADRAECDVVLVTLPDDSGIGAAVADRLRRAAAPRSPSD